MKGYLLLEDGDVLTGELIGYPADSLGEVVFTTGMTGYVESLTDPSFAGQILTFTYPLIGNYGVPKPKYQAPHLLSNFESEKIWVRGVILQSAALIPSHYDSVESFSDWLTQHKIPGLVGIDTRALTQKLREVGVMKGGILTKKKKILWKNVTFENVVPTVSYPDIITYTSEKPNGKHLALIDCGVKHGILRAFLQQGYTITRFPWNKNPLDAQTSFDGVVISNGPGDPKDCMPTVEIIRSLLKTDIPLLGICLGHQLLALAVGADTYKLKYGHRGLNQPCQDVLTQKCYLTSQNHGYAVDPKRLPGDFQEWFINLNDRTNEGIKHKTKKICSTQFHPEGSPGPFDTDFLFSLL